MGHHRGKLAASLTSDGAAGREMFALATKLFPVNRSLTGDGVRKTLSELQSVVPLAIHDIPSGMPVHDWTVPPEWNLRSAHISNSRGNRIVDVATNNLHVVGYSIPVDKRMTLDELMPHLHSLPEQPQLIPYRTSYYRQTWGFCLSHQQLARLEDDVYHVVIDSDLDAGGSMTYGELFLPGEIDDEVLLSAHVCHPSLANDNCSGIALLTSLARVLASTNRRLGYRILIAPGTIGSVAWLALNPLATARIRHGLVISNVGDGGGPTYKRSRKGTADIDRAAQLALQSAGASTEIRNFSPFGYDERQYCSPGFDLPVGSFQRSSWGEFSEYHTSADNLDFIKPEHLERSLRLIVAILDILEGNERFLNTRPFGEPQLGRRGLYDAPDGRPLPESTRMAMLWILNLSDGSHNLIDIAERSGIPFSDLRSAADRLLDAGLLEQS
jgi:aminopeptidase-like protein